MFEFKMLYYFVFLLYTNMRLIDIYSLNNAKTIRFLLGCSWGLCSYGSWRCIPGWL